MLDYARTESDLELRASVRAFANAEIAPFAETADREREVPPSLASRFHQSGIGRRFLDIDRPYLGEICMVTEELGYACASCSSYLMLPVFFNRFLLRVLNEDQALGLRETLEREPVITSFAASEREAGSDFHAMSVTATQTSTGFRLSGRKEYSTNARHARQVIVVAKTMDPLSADAQRGALSWFLVPADAPGVRVRERWNTLGLRALDVSPIEFDGVELPKSALLGRLGGGLALMNQNLAQSRTGIAALAVGIARRARDLVIDFAKTRRLYGERLNRLQDYRFRIADMEMDIAAARGLVAASTGRHDSGLDHNKDASVAKLYAGRMVMRVTESAALMLGSIGYTGQSPVEKLFRDARHVAIVEGPEPIHREIVFAELLRHGAT